MAKILVVEDDVDLNKAYQIILERAHHTIQTAFNGADALKQLDDFDPELILLDLLMPVKSGVEFLRDITKQDKQAGMKVVIFTNLENSPEINEAFRLGAYKCIVKSWTAPQGLVKVVNDILGSRQSSKI